jgi:TonB-dependent SusC/RagA subfamily outer membrane receptor
VRPRVVLPAWALDVDPRERALMLTHEREHVRAGDPLLLAAAAAAAALAPWSPAVWWQLHRLRLAVEVDCDRRVLRHHPDVRAYGGLLLDVARRAHPPTPRLAVAALASPVTSLERRIRIMTSRRSRRTAAHAAALSAAAVALAIAACETPRPTAPHPEARPALTKITAASADLAPASGLIDAKIRAALERHYPAVLGAATGRQQRVWFVADAAGNIVHSALERSGDAPSAGVGKVNPAEIASVDVMKMAPGRLGPDSLAVVWVALRAPGSKEQVAVRVDGTTMRGERVTRVGGNTVAVAGATAGGAAGAALVRVRQAEGAPLAARVTTPKAEPLYLVDGREIPAADVKATLASLRPEGIASVEVLKGAAAAAAYGDKGANGIVKITTKITTKRAPTERLY